MLKLVSLTACGTFAAYAALSTAEKWGFPALQTAIMSGFVTAVLWHQTGLFLRWMHRNDLDAALMHGGYCPCCKKARTLEVTSQQEDPYQTGVRCINCKEAFIITASEGGPLVKRLGKV